MTEKQKLDQLRAQLLAYSDSWDIAGFLMDEIRLFVRSLNSYKLQKLMFNKTLFKRFMFLLDDQNTKQLGYALDDRYYLSARWASALSKKKQLDSRLTHARVIQVASTIKAMYVFQAVEFCNWSMDRMKVIDFARIRASIVKKCQSISK
jgi:hypothetical protein